MKSESNVAKVPTTGKNDTRANDSGRKKLNENKKPVKPVKPKKK